MTLVDPEEAKKKEGSEHAKDATINVKTPKRVLHFSDGVLEEYSDDEGSDVSVQKPEPSEPLIDPSNLPWMPWFWFKVGAASSSTLSAVDTVGEYLASFLGITTPKYYFEIEEYKKIQAEKKMEKEMEKGWSQPVNEDLELNQVTEQPQASL